MGYRKKSSREYWENYCSENSDMLNTLGLNEWVLRSENNFRDFVTNGVIDTVKEIKFSFNSLTKEQYDNLYDFIAEYFDYEIQCFSSFNETI